MFELGLGWIGLYGSRSIDRFLNHELCNIIAIPVGVTPIDRDTRLGLVTVFGMESKTRTLTYLKKKKKTNTDELLIFYFF